MKQGISKMSAESAPHSLRSVATHLNPSVSTKKKPPVMTECEVKVRWLPCTLYEALTERD